MLTISKPTVFGPDGLAARGQCNHDSPGWQLRWFEAHTQPVMVWRGAFKTCRHLQSSCVAATSLEEVKTMVEELLKTASFTHFASQPTDAYPTLDKEEQDKAAAPEGGGAPAKKRRKKKRH